MEFGEAFVLLNARRIALPLAFRHILHYCDEAGVVHELRSLVIGWVEGVGVCKLEIVLEIIRFRDDIRSLSNLVGPVLVLLGSHGDLQDLRSG